jgi:hypothetical protein
LVSRRSAVTTISSSPPSAPVGAATVPGAAEAGAVAAWLSTTCAAAGIAATPASKIQAARIFSSPFRSSVPQGVGGAE